MVDYVGALGSLCVNSRMKNTRVCALDRSMAPRKTVAVSVVRGCFYVEIRTNRKWDTERMLTVINSESPRRVNPVAVGHEEEVIKVAILKRN